MSLPDYIVVAAYLIGIVLVGSMVARRRQTSTDDYLMGGRSIPWLAGTASVIATAISCKSVIGLPGLAYAGDLTYMQMYLVVPLSAWLVSVTLLPHFSKLRITSVYEFLGRRFGPGMQSLGSLMFQVETSLVLGTVIAAPCLVMSEATGVPYNVWVIVLLAATLLYTSMGGIQAVVWTDVVQFVVLTAVTLTVALYALFSLDGGAAAIWKIAESRHKLRLFDFSFNLQASVTFWSALVSMLFWHASSYGSNQVLVQRYMTASSQRDCRRSMLWGSAGSVFLWGHFLLIGVILFGYSQIRPGVIPPGTAADRVFTSFAMAALPAGLRGAFVAAAFAAGMSTLSGTLNSMGTVSLVDIWKLHFNDGADGRVWVRRARWLTLGWGVFSFAAALFVLRFGTVITAGIKLGSVISGALLGMFLLGAFVEAANSAGVVIGVVCGVSAVIGVLTLTTISWAWYCGIGTVVTVCAGSVASFCLCRRREIKMQKIVLLFVVMFAAGALYAQGNFGAITGTVSDPTGAAIPAARVSARNLATGLELSTTTGTAGLYLVPNVLAGEYVFTVLVPSFKKFQQEPIIVSTATTTSVDVMLEVGATSETITVSTASTRLETATSGIGTVLSETAYKELPLDINGMDTGSSGIRQPQQFIFMTPGVTGNSFAHRMSGGQSNSESVQVDGHSWLLLNSPARLVSNPPPFDAIQEFKVNASQYAAENPVGTGGTQLTFKSGTDQFHGALFSLLRNDFLNARGFFTRQTSPLKLSESTASLGGPVLLPHYNGRGRTHFYATFTRFSRRGLDNAASLNTVPTDAFRRGDFSGWVDSKGQTIPIYDPASTTSDGKGSFTRTQFPGNVIPSSRITKAAQNTTALMPEPTLPGVLNNYIQVAASNEDWDSYSAKVDHSWTSNEITRFTFWENRRTRTTVSGFPGPLGADFYTVVDCFNYMVSHTSVITPRVVNEARWSLAPLIAPQSNVGLFKGTAAELLGIPNLPPVQSAMPVISIPEAGKPFGNGGSVPFGDARHNFAFGDSLSWVRGRHQFKFGASAIISYDTLSSYLHLMGTFNFDRRSTSLPDSPSVGTLGHSYASFLLGQVFSGTRLIANQPTFNRVRQFDSFVQDDYKVSRRLTLNLGLNYHIPLPFVDGADELSMMDPTVPNPGAGGLLGAMVYSGNGPGRLGRTTLVNTYYKALAPRFGFAYGLDAKTVLRGGIGIYYGMAPSNTIIDGAPSEGYTYTQSVTSLDQGITPAFNFSNGFPVVNITLPQLDPSLKNGSSAIYVTPDSRFPPLSLNWSFGIQRELPGNLFLDAAYVANHGTRLPSRLENINQLNPSLLSLGALLNQNITSAAAQQAHIAIPYPGFTGTVSQALRPYPQYTSITDPYQGNGYSTYNSLQLKVEKRFSQGLIFMNAYTFSKLIDTGGAGVSASDPMALDNFNRNLEKSLASDDQRHTLVTSWIYELPFGVGKPFLASNRLLANLLGNWRVSSSMSYHSGSPLSLSSSQTLPLFGGTNRPNYVSGQAMHTGTGNFDPAKDVWLNRAAFVDPAPFTFGTLGRTLPNVRGPAFLNENVAVTKEIRLRERHAIELRATAQNVFNRTVFGNPNASLASPLFGQISSQTNLPRQLELQVQYRF